jgi:hypothetical protein
MSLEPSPPPGIWYVVSALVSAISGLAVGRMTNLTKKAETSATTALQTYDILIRERAQIAEELDETRDALHDALIRAAEAEAQHTECEIRGIERQREYGELWIRARQLEHMLNLDPDEALPDEVPSGG